MIDETSDAVYIPTAEDEAEWDRLHFYGMALDAALAIRPRAQGMADHADRYGVTSQTIIECVVNGEEYIARIWDARTQGTHGKVCRQLTIERYDSTKTPRPANPSGKLPGCLTAEELQNANKAAAEFDEWLRSNRPVAANDAVKMFRDIGSRHQSVDRKISFIWTLEEARHILELLRKAGL